MFSRLSKRVGDWQAKGRPQDTIELDLLGPEAPFFAVGDIHGCKSILKNLMRRIDEFADGSEKIVFLGDYIDRGLESQQVLIWLFELTQAFPDRVICLMGNHERMMLDFIDDPAGREGIGCAMVGWTPWPVSVWSGLLASLMQLSQ